MSCGQELGREVETQGRERNHEVRDRVDRYGREGMSGATRHESRSRAWGLR